MPNYMKLARDSYDREDYERACELCAQVSSDLYPVYESHSLWGEALLGLGEFKQAADKFLAASQSATAHLNAAQTSELLFKSGIALARAGEYEEAAHRYIAGIAASDIQIDLLSTLLSSLDLFQTEQVLNVITDEFKAAFQIEITDAEELGRLLNGLLSSKRAILGEQPSADHTAHGEPPTGCNHTVVQVHYITDRKRTPNSAPNAIYGGDRGELEYGFCEVSIPGNHPKGQFESPSILRLEFGENPAKHISLLRVQQLAFEDFIHTVQSQVTATPQNEAFVFVHGYNVTFKDAARRTAQLAYDLELTGVPIFYSWPSQGRLRGYLVDETNVEWTAAHLKQTLQMLMRSCGIQVLHLIGHSMGNRALANAVRQMMAESVQGLPLAAGQMILTAPDIDRDTFTQLSNELRRAARRVTIYASSNDSALHISKRFHGYPRAGDTAPNVLLVDGLDTIDASAVNTSLVGHSYFATDRSVLADLFELLRNGTAPDKRFGLMPLAMSGLRYWSFQS